jgi:hypothetical protein
MLLTPAYQLCWGPTTVDLIRGAGSPDAVLTACSPVVLGSHRSIQEGVKRVTEGAMAQVMTQACSTCVQQTKFQIRHLYALMHDRTEHHFFHGAA